MKRTEGRRRLHRLGVLAIVVATIVGLWWLTLTPLLDVDAIKVQGATQTGDAAVLATIGIHHGEPLLTADVGGAASRLTRLPWIATASVRRSWPGTVRVSVTERIAVAAIASKDGGWVEVDRGGRELAVAKEPPVELLRVAGRPLAAALGAEVPTAFRGSLDLAAVVPAAMRARLAALWPQGDGSVEATVVIAPKVTATARFGAADQLEAKLVSLEAVLERADLRNVHIIDLRVPDAPALTRG